MIKTVLAPNAPWPKPIPKQKKKKVAHKKPIPLNVDLIYVPKELSEKHRVRDSTTG